MREAVDARPSLGRPLYRAVTELLVDLAAKPAMAVAPYSLAEYQRELGLFIEWYCPAVDLTPDGAKNLLRSGRICLHPFWVPSQTP